jgi:hypothetical protein
MRDYIPLVLVVLVFAWVGLLAARAERGGR